MLKIVWDPTKVERTARSTMTICKLIISSSLKKNTMRHDRDGDGWKLREETERRNEQRQLLK